jgi:hypothetical protein
MNPRLTRNLGGDGLAVGLVGDLDVLAALGARVLLVVHGDDVGRVWVVVTAGTGVAVLVVEGGYNRRVDVSV